MAKIEVDVVADAKQFERGISSANKSLDKFDKTAQQTDKTLGKLSKKRIALNADTSKLDSALDRVSSRFRRLNNQTVRLNVTQTGGSLSRIQSQTAQIGSNIGGWIKGAAIMGVSLALVTGPMGDLFNMTIGAAAAAEVTAIQFKTLLGSATKAGKVLKSLAKFAADTPFEMPEVKEAAKLLLAFGVSAKDLEKTLTFLGDTASSLGLDFSDLAALWGKMSQQTNLYAEDLNQLSERGIPVVQILAKELGITTDEVKKLASEGKLLTKDVLPLLNRELTKKYGGGMKALSKTLIGQWSTLKDTIATAFGSLGGAALPVIKLVLPEFQKQAEDLAKKMEENRDAITAKVAQFGAAFLRGVQGLISGLGQFFAFLASTGASLLKGIAAFLYALEQIPGIDIDDSVIKDLLTKSNALKGAAEDIGDTFNGWADALNPTIEKFDTMAKTFGEVADFNKNWKPIKFEVEGQKATLDALAAVNKDGNKVITYTLKVGKNEAAKVFKVIEGKDGQKVKFFFDAKGMNPILGDLKKIEKYKGKTVGIDIDADGVDDLLGKLDIITKDGKTVAVLVQEDGTKVVLNELDKIPSEKGVDINVIPEGVGKTKADIAGIEGKRLPIGLYQTGADTVQSEIYTLKGKIIKIPVYEDKEDNTSSIQKAIDALKGKDIFVNVKTATDGLAAGSTPTPSPTPNITPMSSPRVLAPTTRTQLGDNVNININNQYPEPEKASDNLAMSLRIARYSLGVA